MGKIKKILRLLVSADGIYGLLTNPLVTTVLFPAVLALGAGVMAWARDLPWLEVYVVFFFVAACVAVIMRQILDRWQMTTDREKLIYIGMDFNLPLEEGTLDRLIAVIQFKNDAHKRMTVELEKFDLQVENRIQDSGPRKVSKFTIGSGVVGHFGSAAVDLKGLEKDVASAKVKCVVRYGFGPHLTHSLISEMAGQIEKTRNGEYIASFWDLGGA